MQIALNVLEKTVKDLQQNSQVSQKKQAELGEMLAWKLELLRKSLLFQPDFARIDAIGSEKMRTKFDRLVFDKHADLHHQAFLEIIEMLYPGLSAFIKQQYPAFSETEHNVALLLFTGLSTKDNDV